jgi:hypothetical protein
VEPDVLGRYHDGVLPTFRASGARAADDPAPPLPDLLSYLSGEWQVTRRLTDHRSGTSGEFAGTASFRAPDSTASFRAPDSTASFRAPDSTASFRALGSTAGLAYREEGELRFGDHVGPASRELIYLTAEDGGLDVRFSDGRAFYRLDLSGGRWTAGHPCGRDHYQVTGELLGPDRYAEHWQVTGPAKNYEIDTTLVRR